jgi:sugar lactone lactonase YvrE
MGRNINLQTIFKHFWRIKMKIKITWLAGIFLLAMGIIFVACEGPSQPTVDESNDPNPTGKDPAEITSISPDTAFFKETVTITGSGFDTRPGATLVAFGQRFGEIESITETEIVVKTPVYVGETVVTRVSIAGSEFWSNTLPFTFRDLEPEIIDDEISWPNGVAVDKQWNTYVASVNDEAIYKISPDGEKSTFVEIPTSGAIEFGPDEYLYVCQQWEGKIVRVSPDGGTVEDVVEVAGGDGPIDFDWDADGNMYIVSNWAGIFKFDTGGTQTQVAEIDNPKNIRIYENTLTISDIWNGTIWRFDITETGLENQRAVYEGGSPLGVEMDAVGTLYYTEAWETTLYFQDDAGGGGAMYEGLLETPMHYLTFFDKYMYIVYPGWGDVGVVLRVYVGENQAPNYGRGE